MKSITRLLAGMVVAASADAVQTTNLLNDSFTDLLNWKDLSTAIDWGDGTTPASAFVTTGGAAQFNPLIPSSWVGFGETGSGQAKLNMFQALDHQFSAPVEHDRTVLTIEFRVRWEIAQTGGKDGESQRLVILLNHDYPVGGIDLDCVTCPTDPSENWYARPAYQVRVRGGDEGSQAETILMYGGGVSTEGDFEYAASVGYWLPGFVASTAFDENGDIKVVPPGQESSGFFPDSTYVITDGGIASESWQRMRYIVLPDRHQIWRNALDSDNPGDWVLEQEMILPAEALAPVAPLYKYFNTLEGLRVFWRAAKDGDPDPAVYGDNFYIDYLTVDAQVFDDNHQYWASGHYGLSTVMDPALEATTWGFGANTDGDTFPNGVDRYLNQSPLERDAFTIMPMALDERDYAVWAAEEFTEYPDPALEHIWGRFANPDGDVYLNGAEQRLQQEPQVMDPAPEKGLHVFVGDGLILTLHALASTVHGATGELQTSSTLDGWDPPLNPVQYPVWLGESWYVVTEMERPASEPDLFLRYRVTETAP